MLFRSLSLITASPDENEPLLSRERADALRSARPNANNNNSNTTRGQGEGESEGESDGGGGEEESGAGGGDGRETSFPPGESSGAGASSHPGAASGDADAPVTLRGEALLRQPKARRPERPNSLDLSFTTRDLSSLGEYTHTHIHTLDNSLSLTWS